MALGYITNGPAGAQVALEAKVVNHVAELLESPYAHIRQLACWRLGQLARHVEVSAINCCAQLLSLLQ